MFKINNNILLIILILLLIITVSYTYYYHHYNSNINLLKLKELKYNPNIKTCVLISGQVRDNVYQCIMSQKLFIFDPLNVDIFAVFSDDTSDEMKEYVIKLLKPKAILWVGNSNIINNKLNFPKSVYSMTQKILLCNNLKIKYEKNNNFTYDINIRSRIDLIIKNYIPENIINNMKDDTIYYPSLHPLDIHSNGIFGIPDQFILGKSKPMIIFSNMYNYIINTNNNDTDIIEIFYKKYLAKNNIKFIKMRNYKFLLTRMLYENNNIISIVKYANEKNHNKNHMMNYFNIFNYIINFNN